MHDAKGDDYYSHIRDEIMQLLPQRIDRILEIGCGRGETLARIKSTKGASFACGVELSHDSADAAKGKLDRVVVGNFEEIDLPVDFVSFDVVLCLDVLEHFVDPWKAVRQIDGLLSPGGVLIASIPNVRYFSVVLPLLLQGRWEYQSSGVLDRTHLRFFTKRSAIDLMQTSGMSVEVLCATGLEKGRKARYLNMVTFSLFKPFFEFQYLIKVRKAMR